MVDWLRRRSRAKPAEGGPADDGVAVADGIAAPDAGPPEEPETGLEADAGAEGPDAEVDEDTEPGGVACPSCAFWIDPAPRSSRLCPRCRERIVVRRTEGRSVYFTEAAVRVFEAERQRELDEQRWTVERREWLRLAKIAAAPLARRQRLEGQYPSAEVVEASKALYLSSVDNAVRAARRVKHWTEVGRLRREQAAALFAEAGSPVPPPADIVGLHREAAAAQLRDLARTGTHAELIGAGCCKACRGDDGKAFKIVDELRLKRLPHEGCPRGLCACEWWISVPAPPKRRRRKPRPVTAEPAPADVPASVVEARTPDGVAEPGIAEPGSPEPEPEPEPERGV